MRKVKTELTFILLSRGEDTGQWCYWLGESYQILGKGVGGFRLLVIKVIPPCTPYLGSGNQTVDCGACRQTPVRILRRMGNNWRILRRGLSSSHKSFLRLPQQNIPRLDDINNRNLFSHSFGGWTFKVKLPMGLSIPETSLPGCGLPAVSSHGHPSVWVSSVS